MDNAHAHLIVGDLLQTLLHSFGRALHVGLDHDGQLLHVVLCHLAEQVIQRDLLEGGELLFLGGSNALFGQLTGQTLVLNSLEQVACFRHCGQAGDLHRGRGAGIAQQLALVAAHGAHAAHSGTGDDDIAGVQGAVLHQNGGNGALALVQTGLDDRTLGAAIGVCLQLHDLSFQSNALQQVVDAHAGQGRHRDAGHIAAPVLGDDAVLGQAFHHALGVCGGLIHLVHCHDELDICSLGVVDGLDGLGHDAVVGSNHQNRNIGHVGTAGTHGGERLVARGIQEGDEAVVDLDLICTDGLRNTAGLACGDVGLTDGIQNTGLAVVNVTHDTDHRGTLHQIFLCILFLREQALLDGDVHLVLDLCVELLSQQSCGVEIDHIVDGVHLAHLHELGNDLTGLLLQAGSQLAHGDLVGDQHLQLGVAGLFQLDALQTLELGLALAFLELLALALAALGELLLVALRSGLAAVLGVLGRGQIIVTGIEAIHVHIHSAGIYSDLIVLAADRDCLCGGSGGLCAGLACQLAEGNSLFLALLVLLGLLVAVLAVIVIIIVVCLGLLGLCGGLLGLFVSLGSLGLLLSLLFDLLVSLLLSLGLLLGSLGAVQKLVQICHAVVLAELLQQVVQLVFLQIGAVLLAGAAHSSQLVQYLLCRKVQILCKVTHFIFYDHSLISSSFLIAPQSDRRSKQSFARLRSVTA